MKQSAAGPAEIYQVGRYRVFLPTREIFCGEQRVKIPWRSFEALQILIEAGGEVVDRETFFARLWPGVAVGTSSLNQCLAKLRKELGDPSEGGLIETVARRGYRLTRTPEPIYGPDESSTLRGEQSSLSAVSSLAERIARRHKLPLGLTVLAIVALIGLTLAFGWQRWSRREQARALTAEGFRYVRENRSPPLRDANRLFRRAIELDPSLALAYGGIAEVMARSPDGSPEQAALIAEQSVHMDPRCAECKGIAGLVLMSRAWRFREAQKYLEQAAAEKPGDSRIRLWHAQMLACAGRLDHALQEIDAARRLDAASPAVATMRAGVLYLSGRYEASIASARQALSLQPGYSSAYDWSTGRAFGSIGWRRG